MPIEIIELIQEYVDGQNIYIPRKADNRQEWGSTTQARQELLARDQMIYQDYMIGIVCQRRAYSVSSEK